MFCFLTLSIQVLIGRSSIFSVALLLGLLPLILLLPLISRLPVAAVGVAAVLRTIDLLHVVGQVGRLHLVDEVCLGFANSLLEIAALLGHVGSSNELLRTVTLHNTAALIRVMALWSLNGGMERKGHLVLVLEGLELLVCLRIIGGVRGMHR